MQPENQKERVVNKEKRNVLSSIRCYENILSVGNVEASGDFLRLCRGIGLSEKDAIGTVLLYNNTSTASMGHKIPLPEALPGETLTCQEAAKKYDLGNACSVCRSNPRTAEQKGGSIQTERNVLLYLMNSCYDKKFFPLDLAKEQAIEQNFVAIERVESGSRIMYSPVYRTIYDSLYAEIRIRNIDKKKKLKEQISYEELYGVWTRRHGDLCGDEEGNEAVLKKIKHLFTAEFKDSSNYQTERESFTQGTLVKQKDEKKATRKKKNQEEETILKLSLNDLDKVDQTLNSMINNPEHGTQQEKQPEKGSRQPDRSPHPVMQTMEPEKLTANGYEMRVDEKTLFYLRQAPFALKNGICLDAVHIKGKTGIFILVSAGDRRAILTPGQLPALRNYIGYAEGKITTAAVTPLLSVLRKEGYKTRAAIMQPEGLLYRDGIPEKGQSTAAETLSILVNPEDMLMLRGYASSYSPGTGDEDCLMLDAEGVPFIARARKLREEEKHVTVTAKTKLEPGKWRIIKHALISALERTNEFLCYRAGVWNENDKGQQISFFAEKIKGLDTILTRLTPCIMQKNGVYPSFDITAGSSIKN